MRIVADGEIVVALFEYVRALAVSVVGAERLFIHRHGKRLLAVGVGGEPVGLGKADELYRGLLYAVLFVILGVRFLDIHLHDFLARNAAAVADIERNVVARFGLSHFEVAVLEGRIRQSVAERECDFLIVVPCLFVGRASGGRCALHAEDGILVARFVVSVTDVNAFLINYVFSVVRPIVASVFLVEVGQFIGVFRPGEVAEVGVRRSGMIVVKQSVRRASRHDELVVTDKHVGDLGKAHRAALTYPYARVDAVLLLAYLGELHRVGGVEQEHRLFESARRFERLQVFEHARFFDGELEVVLDAAHHVVAHVLGNIEVLARGARDYHYSRIVGGDGAFRNVFYLAVRGFADLEPRQVVGRRRVGVARLSAVLRGDLFVSFFELGIDLDALGGERRAYRAVHGRDVDLTRAAAAEHVFLRRYAEHADLSARFERERVVVPQQDAALDGGLFADKLGVPAHSRVVAVGRFVAVAVGHVHYLAARVALDIVGLVPIEVLVAVARRHLFARFDAEHRIDRRGVVLGYARAHA